MSTLTQVSARKDAEGFRMTKQLFRVVEVDVEERREYFDSCQERANVVASLLAQMNELRNGLEVGENRTRSQTLETDHGSIVTAD